MLRKIIGGFGQLPKTSANLMFKLRNSSTNNGKTGSRKANLSQDSETKMNNSNSFWKN